MKPGKPSLPAALATRYELTRKGWDAIDRPGHVDKLPADVEAELLRLRVFRGSDLARALLGDLEERPEGGIS